MEYQATAKYLRISTRKARLVADAVRKLSVSQAILQLSIMPKRAGTFLKKVMDSAVANARGKNQPNVEALRIAYIDVSEGPAMKRWHAVSKGTAHAYKKRMTHIRVVLTDDIKNSEVKVKNGGK